MSQLKLIKVLLPSAFKTNKIYIDDVVKYYSEHKDEIVSLETKSIDALKREKLSNDIILQNIEIEEAKKHSIPLKDVEQFMGDFGLQLSSVLKAKIVKELPPQIIGLKEEEVIKICRDVYNSIIELWKSNEKMWDNKEQ